MLNTDQLRPWAATDHQQLAALLRSRLLSRSIGDAVTRMASPGSAPASIRFERIKFAAGRSLSINFRVSQPDGEGWPGFAKFSPFDGPPSEPVAPAECAANGEPAAETEVFDAAPAKLRDVHPDVRWRVDHLATPGLTVSLSPFDPAFPGLQHLHSLSDRDDHSPERIGAVRTVRYRPGSRHVLDTRLASGERAFLKIERPGRAAARASAAVRFADAVGTGVAVVRPLAVIGDAVAYGDTGRTRRRATIDQLIASLDSIHCGAAVDASGPTIAGELQSLSRTLANAAPLFDDRGRAERFVDLLDRRVADVEPDQVVLVHGDAKTDHFHTVGRGVAVIDTDRAGMGERALDLGNLLADVWWETPLRYGALRSALASRGLASGRVDLVEAMATLRIALRRTPLRRSTWPRQIDAAIRRAETLLAGRAER